jgi:uncharacterized protein YndB with AHSA1/START domain
MRIVKWLIGIVLVLALVVVLGGLMLSPKFNISRSLTMNAAPDKVYGLIASPKRWKEWTVWNQRDPAMTVTYSGPESGVGAGWAWKSRNEGDGRMTFTAAEPGAKLAYQLYFGDTDSPSTGELRLSAEGSATRVTWTMSGDVGGNPVGRWFALLAERFVGPDFEAGLANLKALAEKP